MSDISSTSGLDIQKIINTLMIDKSRQMYRYEAQKDVFEVQLSSYGSLKNLVSTFQDKITALSNAFNQVAYQATSSDTTVFNATITGNSITKSSYNINITQLAKNQQIASGTFTQKDTALNLSSTLNVSIGTQSFFINLDPSNTLENIRDNINQSNNNIGITASILSTTASDGSTQYQLILSSKNSGTANQMTLSGAAVTDLNLTNEITTAQDAKFTINNTFNVVRSSNIIDDVLDGVSFQLNNLGTATLSISQASQNRNQAVQSAIKDAVNAYNQVMSYIDLHQASRTQRDEKAYPSSISNSNSRYGTFSLNDSTFTLIKQKLQEVASNSLGGDYLYNFGIVTADPQTDLVSSSGDKYTSTGQLKINDTDLAAKIDGNFDAIKALFTDSNTGFVKKFSDAISSIIDFDGMIPNQSSNLQEQSRYYSNKIDDEQDRLDMVRENLIKQYSALDALLQTFQSTSDFLTAQLASLKKSN